MIIGLHGGLWLVGCVSYQELWRRFCHVRIGPITYNKCWCRCTYHPARSIQTLKSPCLPWRKRVCKHLYKKAYYEHLKVSVNTCINWLFMKTWKLVVTIGNTQLSDTLSVTSWSVLGTTLDAPLVLPWISGVPFVNTRVPCGNSPWRSGQVYTASVPRGAAGDGCV